MTEIEFSRREVLAGAGVLAGGMLVGVPATAAAEPAATGRMTLSEGTNMAAAASPDGRQVAIDLLTVLWVLPIGGGDAVRLTDDLADATQPRWSPDGSKLVFRSYRDGNYHLWTVAPDGSGLRQLTSGRFDHREPAFSPDGATVVFASDRGGTGSYGIHLLDLASGDITALTDTAAEEAQSHRRCSSRVARAGRPTGRRSRWRRSSRSRPTAAAAVESVLVGGVVRTVDELLAPFATPAAAATPADAVLVPASFSSGRGFAVPAADARGAWWHRPEWSERVCCEA